MYWPRTASAAGCLFREPPGGGEWHRVPKEVPCNEGQDLQEMVLHDVTHRADGVVESPAILDSEVLGHRDLDRLDVLAVPDRLEQGVREAEVDDVLHRLLAEKVVDAEEALLGEDRGQPGSTRGGVGAEWLFHDQACRSDIRGGQLVSDVEERRRRINDVEEGVVAPETVRRRSYIAPSSASPPMCDKQPRNSSSTFRQPGHPPPRSPRSVLGGSSCVTGLRPTP
jgi:hypothetical protein